MSSFFLTYTSVFTTTLRWETKLTGSFNQFNQSVRIRSIVLHSANPQQGPKTIKLLVNRPAIDFEDVQDDEEVAQVLEVPEDTSQPIPLRYVRFQSVNSLHVSTTAAASHSGKHVTFVDLRRIKSRRSRPDSHRFCRCTRIFCRVRRPSIVSYFEYLAQPCPPARQQI